MKNTFVTRIIVLSAFLFNFCVVHAQSWEWARQYSSPSYENGYAITTDPSFNCYITGRFGEGFQMGNFHLFGSENNNNIFVAKLSSDGQVLWAKTAVGNDNDVGADVALDNNSNVFITGHFGSTCNFSGTNLISNGGMDFFLAKYDGSGNLIWIRNFGSSMDDGGSVLTTDLNGNIYACGSFQDSITIGNTIVHTLGQSDLFVIKYDNNGTFCWIKSLVNPNMSRISGINADASGNIYIAGDFWGSLYIGTDSLSNPYSKDLFLIKLDSNGNTIWLKDGSNQFENNDVFCYASDIDKDGNIYLAGSFDDTLYFGDNQVINYSNNSDAFLCKFDTAGNHLWAVHCGGGGSDFTGDIACDKNANIYQTGTFFVQAQFGTITIYDNVSPFASAYLAICDSSGNFKWAETEIQSSHDTRFDGIAVCDSAVYQTGYMSGGPVSLGPYNFNIVGGYDMLVSKRDFSSNQNENPLIAQSELFPNPVKTTLYVKLEKPEELEIFNMLGAKLNARVNIIDSNHAEIDVSHFSKGVYFIKSENFSEKFVKM